jgi:hypothetical protein
VNDPGLRDTLTRPWDLAFVDQHPCEARGPAIQMLRVQTRFIVAHDTEPSTHVHRYGYEPLLSSFKYRFDYKRFIPWTTVVSDHVDVREIMA